MTLPLALRLTLYSRSYCHLCDDLLAGLLAMSAAPQPFTVDVIDVDAAAEAGDPGPLARFDALVPVLFGDLQQPALCHYFLDEAAVLQWLASAKLPACQPGVA